MHMIHFLQLVVFSFWKCICLAESQDFYLIAEVMGIYGRLLTAFKFIFLNAERLIPVNQTYTVVLGQIDDLPFPRHNP